MLRKLIATCIRGQVPFSRNSYAERAETLKQELYSTIYLITNSSESVPSKLHT
jgi:hypothetical protein